MPDMQGLLEEVEIDLRGGIYTNETPYALQSHIAEAQNAVWGWRYPQVDSSFTPDHLPPHFLRMPTYFPARDPITYQASPAMFLDIAFTGNNNIVGGYKLIIGTNSSNVLRAWTAEPGIAITLAAGVATQVITPSADPFPATSVHWDTPGSGAKITGPATFWSHKDSDVLYVLFDSGMTVESMQHRGVAAVPLKVRALAVHLDRLWMAQLRTGSSLTSDLWYTDPFDAETIRPESSVNIEDIVNVITASIPGQLDVSGVPHLFIGCDNSIWMIDGDPSNTQALRRQIASSVGCRSPLGVAVSQYGVFFVGTDHDIYLCSTDGRSVLPVGGPIRDRININASSLEDGGLRASLCWFAPYLYYFPSGNPAFAYVCDMTDPQKPVWWGPVQSVAQNFSTIAVTKATPTGSPIHAPTSFLGTPAIYTAGLLGSSTGHFQGFDRFTQALGTYPHGHELTRPQSIVTGYIGKQGHKAQLVRVTLQTDIKTNPYLWTVTGLTDLTGSQAGKLSSSTPIHEVGGGHRAQKLLYTFEHNAKVQSDIVQILIAGPSTSQTPETNGMGLQKVRAQVRYFPYNT